MLNPNMIRLLRFTDKHPGHNGGPLLLVSDVRDQIFPAEKDGYIVDRGGRDGCFHWELTDTGKKIVQDFEELPR